jgi:hypothetical protein
VEPHSLPTALGLIRYTGSDIRPIDSRLDGIKLRNGCREEEALRRQETKSCDARGGREGTQDLADSMSKVN